MKVDSEIDVEEDMPFAGPSQIIFWWNHEASALKLVPDDSRNLHFWELLVKGNL